MFGGFERWVAWRYLRARRSEGFISVVAGFSLIGIALGVATLIIVMSVMNGFRIELLTRLLGINGHVTVYAQQIGEGIADFDVVASDIRGVERVVRVTPQVEAQSWRPTPARRVGRWCAASAPRTFANVIW